MPKRALGTGASCCGDPEACDLCTSQVEVTTPDAGVTVIVDEDEPIDNDPFDEEDDE